MLDPSASEAWKYISHSIRQLSTTTGLPDTANGAFIHESWTWLDEPMPDAIETAVAKVAAAHNWNLEHTRTYARKIYYEELRRVTENHLMLHQGVPLPNPLPPDPIESLPSQPALDTLQLGYLHARGQLIADQQSIAESIHYKWRNILNYGGWLVTDPRNLEGAVDPLESRVDEFTKIMRKRIPAVARTSAITSGFETSARFALYHAYWYRLNVRLTRMELARLRGHWHPRGPKPLPQPYGVSHQGAEHICAEWLAYLGAANARVTRASGDGGIDVLSDSVIAQVKNYAGTVGVEEIRAFHGVATVDGRVGVFFTSGKYASGAVEFADLAGMPLFTYNAVEGSLHGANSLGSVLAVGGIPGT